MISHSRSVGSRYRKQRFPRPDRRRTVAAFDASCVDDDYDSGDENCYSLTKRPREHDSPNLPMNRSVKQGLKSIETKTAAVQSFSRVDKRARDEHNEQERSRRRELAVIYELIRCSLVPEDLKRLDHGSQAKSISKLSYPQVLQIAYHVVKEEQHHLLLLEQTINDIKRLEKELARAGLHVPPRPPYPSITDCYKKVVTVVDEVLRHDKSARTPNGVYDMTPAQRAAQGDEELFT
ncbi:unnamed protein product [Protopolystoma xenopodis]|uniref:BHLH domain-containing protein n=1 Tax=Protopolystoma xenopodis TaxID=117903 RepID=A0A448X9E9_9PLAT|nr:unnamed protein product [Protopolystoma xenopodis]